MTLPDKKGFTLVEVVVAGMLLMILAIGGYSFFFVFTREKNETAAYLMAQTQAEMFIEELARKVRESNFVLPVLTNNPEMVSLEEYSALDADGNYVPVVTNSVYLYRYGETVPWGAFWVEEDDNGQLIVKEMEKMAGSTPTSKPLTFMGGRPVLVADRGFDEKHGMKHAGEPANVKKFAFKLLPAASRRLLEVDITISPIKDKTDLKLRVERGTFICRI